jgi:hypothetical protein
MNDLRKITAFVSARDLEHAQAVTGEGVSETLRLALRQLAHRGALQELRALRGAIREDFDLHALREDRDLDTFAKP